MLKLLFIGLGCLILMPGIIDATTEDMLFIKEPVLVTSIGQNYDALIIKVILDTMKINNDFIPLACSEDLTEYEQIFIVTGLSYKGITSINITFEDEVQRANRLIECARELSCNLVFVYLGGFIQRDDKSKQLVDIVASKASAMIVYLDSKATGTYFCKLADEVGVPVFFIKNLSRIKQEFEEFFVY